MNFMRNLFKKVLGFFKPKQKTEKKKIKEEIDEVEWFLTKKILPIMPKVEPRKDGLEYFSVKENPYFAVKVEETAQEYIEQLCDNGMKLDIAEDLQKQPDVDLERDGDVI